MNIVDFGLPIDSTTGNSQIGNWRLKIENELAGMTRLELANQLIENQPAFHFALIPVIVWCAWSDLNPEESGVISDFGFRISKCEFRSEATNNSQFEIRNSKFGLVPAEGFEPTLSSF
jgi:hypothetical protein